MYPMGGPKGCVRMLNAEVRKECRRKAEGRQKECRRKAEGRKEWRRKAEGRQRTTWQHGYWVVIVAMAVWCKYVQHIATS